MRLIINLTRCPQRTARRGHHPHEAKSTPGKGVCQAMKGGDLSNIVSPRLIVVFEGAVGVLPEGKVKDHGKAAKRNDWRKAVRYFELNEMMLGRILYLNWKKNFNI